MYTRYMTFKIADYSAATKGKSTSTKQKYQKKLGNLISQKLSIKQKYINR